MQKHIASVIWFVAYCVASFVWVSMAFRYPYSLTPEAVWFTIPVVLVTYPVILIIQVVTAVAIRKISSSSATHTLRWRHIPIALVVSAILVSQLLLFLTMTPRHWYARSISDDLPDSLSELSVSYHKMFNGSVTWLAFEIDPADLHEVLAVRPFERTGSSGHSYDQTLTFPKPIPVPAVTLTTRYHYKAERSAGHGSAATIYTNDAGSIVYCHFSTY